MNRMMVAAALACAMTAPATAGVVMTFDTLKGNMTTLFQSHSENGFTLTRTAGSVNVNNAWGAPLTPDDPLMGAPSLVNNTFGVAYALTGGGQAFTFDQFGLNVNYNSPVHWFVTGRRAGQTVYSLSGWADHFHPRFGAIKVSTGTVDEVELKFDSFSPYQNPFAGASGLDNLGMTFATASSPGGGAGAVPEPATWAMMIFGLGMAGSAMRRRARVPAC